MKLFERENRQKRKHRKNSNNSEISRKSLNSDNHYLIRRRKSSVQHFIPYNIEKQPENLIYEDQHHQHHHHYHHNRRNYNDDAFLKAYSNYFDDNLSKSYIAHSEFDNLVKSKDSRFNWMQKLKNTSNNLKDSNLVRKSGFDNEKMITKHIKSKKKKVNFIFSKNFFFK